MKQFFTRIPLGARVSLMTVTVLIVIVVVLNGSVGTLTVATSRNRVEQGVQLTAGTATAIGQLSSVIDESAQAAMQMVAGGRQQAAGVAQIALAMDNINQATQQSLASIRQAERAAQDLNELAGQLAEIVDQYQSQE